LTDRSIALEAVGSGDVERSGPRVPERQRRPGQRALPRRRGAEVDESFLVPGAGHQAFLKDPDGTLIELNQPDPTWVDRTG